VRPLGFARLGLWLLAFLLVCCLAGCEPSFYGGGPKPAPLPPPAPPAPPPQVTRPLFYVTANRLNLRACPGMDCPKISVLERNEEVEKVGESEDWSQIRVKRDGRLGWVNTRYLSAQPASEAPAAPEAAPAPLPVPPAVTTPMPPPLPPPLPERPPAAEKPKPAKPVEAKPAKPAKPAEAAEPPKRKPPAEEKPAVEKPPPPVEKPTPPPGPEPSGRIRIM
jgi:hypothetical protein